MRVIPATHRSSLLRLLTMTLLFRFGFELRVWSADRIDYSMLSKYRAEFLHILVWLLLISAG